MAHAQRVPAARVGGAGAGAEVRTVGGRGGGRRCSRGRCGDSVVVVVVVGAGVAAGTGGRDDGQWVEGEAEEEGKQEERRSLGRAHAEADV